MKQQLFAYGIGVAVVTVGLVSEVRKQFLNIR
jgi:hypothetical protein